MAAPLRHQPSVAGSAIAGLVHRRPARQALARTRGQPRPGRRQAAQALQPARLIASAACRRSAASCTALAWRSVLRVVTTHPTAHGCPPARPRRRPARGPAAARRRSITPGRVALASQSRGSRPTAAGARDRLKSPSSSPAARARPQRPPGSASAAPMTLLFGRVRSRQCDRREPFTSSRTHAPRVRFQLGQVGGSAGCGPSSTQETRRQARRCTTWPPWIANRAMVVASRLAA
jgi:hypothetical protein